MGRVLEEADGSGRVRVMLHRSQVPRLDRLATTWGVARTVAFNHCIDLAVWMQDHIDAGHHIAVIDRDGNILEG